MFKIILKSFIAFVFWGIFVWVIFYIEPPKSLTQADILQLAYFFLPLFFALTFTINLLFNSYLASGSLAMGLILLLILKALDLFNIIYVLITVISTVLLFSYFQKDFSNLTSLPFVPKLGGLRRKRK